jgi:hypothetical protein
MLSRIPGRDSAGEEIIALVQRKVTLTHRIPAVKVLEAVTGTATGPLAQSACAMRPRAYAMPGEPAGAEVNFRPCPVNRL